MVAHFFRRAFNLIRQGGAFGLIATNTIAQGDTRNTGLRWICEHGGEIYDVNTRVKWPGLAAVVVSVLHICKGSSTRPKHLDGETVEKITAFLFHRGGHRDPARLKANARQSFQGSIVLGMGFTFDDTDRKGVATSLAEMHRLLADNPRNKDAIFPYIGGEEVNTSPTHATIATSSTSTITRCGERTLGSFGRTPVGTDGENCGGRLLCPRTIRDRWRQIGRSCWQSWNRKYTDSEEPLYGSLVAVRETAP